MPKPRQSREPKETVVPKKHAEITFDYKDAETLKKYMTERGDILSKERSGLSSKEQRDLSRAIKRARALALLPFVTTL